MAGEFGSRIIPQVSFEKIFISKSIVHSSEKSYLRIPVGSSADRFITYRKIELRVIIVDQFRLPAPVAFPFITHHIGSCRKLENISVNIQIVRCVGIDRVTVCFLRTLRSEEHTSELQSRDHLVC